MLALLVVSALVLFHLVPSYVAPMVAVSSDGGRAVLVALLVFGVGLFAGNRAVGRPADRFGSLRVLTVALALAGVLWRAPAAAVAAAAVLGVTRLAAAKRLDQARLRDPATR
ncbi:MAG TPA: hypothetical protein VF053_04635 [Streptosporangiales bacterium]